MVDETGISEYNTGRFWQVLDDVGIAKRNGTVFFSVDESVLWISCSIGSFCMDGNEGGRGIGWDVGVIKGDVERYVTEGVISQVDRSTLGRVERGRYSDRALLTEESIRSVVSVMYQGVRLLSIGDYVRWREVVASRRVKKTMPIKQKPETHKIWLYETLAEWGVNASKPLPEGTVSLLKREFEKFGMSGKTLAVVLSKEGIKGTTRQRGSLAKIPEKYP